MTILLAPICLQMTHFLVVDLFWILLVLAQLTHCLPSNISAFRNRREIASCLSNSWQEVFTCR